MFRTLATLATAGLVLLAPGTAVADGGATPAPTLPPEAHERLELACARVPNLQLRTERLLERLPADEDRRGSIAWVRARAERARAAGYEQLATLLDSRADVLDDKLDTLPAQQEWLDQAAGWCAQLDATGLDEAS